MPTLRELDAFFVRYEKGVAGPGHGRPLPDGTTQWGGFEVDVIRHVDSLADAHGVWLLCPACYVRNGGKKGTHSLDVSFAGRGVPDTAGSHDSTGAPSRWTVVSGTGLDDLVLSPSIYLKDCPPCNWHGFIGMSGVPPGNAQ